MGKKGLVVQRSAKSGTRKKKQVQSTFEKLAKVVEGFTILKETL